MTGFIDIRRLRTAEVSQQARLLREAAAQAPEAGLSITQQLLAELLADRIPFVTLQVWLSIAQSPIVAVVALKQSHNALVRQAAIRMLAAHLRSAGAFVDTWDALGGASGIAELLAECSVTDLRSLLKAFRTTSTAPGAREERQQRMLELFEVLNDPKRNPERRPLKVHYARIVPACASEIALQWSGKLDDKLPPGWEDLFSSYPFEKSGLQKSIQQTHRDALLERTLDRSFGSEDCRVHLDELRPFMGDSVELSVKVVGLFARSRTLRGVTEKDLVHKLLLNVAKRCSRHRSDNVLDAQFWTDLTSLLQRYPLLASGDWMVSHSQAVMFCKQPRWGARRKSVIEYAASRWSRRQKSSEGDVSLGELISLVPKELIHRLDLNSIMLNTPYKRRYTLLRLFYLHANPYRIDIGLNPGPPSSSQALVGLRMSATMFIALPNSEAVALFERYRDVNPECGSLTPDWVDSSSPSALSLFLHGKETDETLYPDGIALRAYLLQREWSEAIHESSFKSRDLVFEDMKTNELDRRRKRAAQGSTPELRSGWAMAALCLCTAMGDLDAYADTWIWARRFNRDAPTVRNLYSGSLLVWGSASDMLAVLPKEPRPARNIEESVLKVNKIIQSLFETATMAVREPSFKRSNWTTILNLPGQIAEKRLRRLDKMQDFLGWTDAEVFDKILRPTVDLLIDAESHLLQPENMKHKTRHPHGLFQKLVVGKNMVIRPHVAQFLNVLAQKRDELWAQHRAATKPGTITLEKPWPRGLPIQYLLPDLYPLKDGSTDHLLHHTKGVEYVRQRAEFIVFCNKEKALAPLPADEEVQEAIGSHADRWVEALKIYISGADGKAERQTRIDRALTHALGSLRDDRMTHEEATRFWHGKFRQAGVEWEELGATDPDQYARQPARLPEADPSHGPVEWNPDPLYPTIKGISQKTRRLPGVTCLDFMLVVSVLRSWNYTYESAIQRMDALVLPGAMEYIPEYWDVEWHQESSPPKTRDLVGWKDVSVKMDLKYSRIIAAILHVNSAKGADTSLLMQPFPSEDDPLFPAVYLSQEFLERKSRDGWEPIRALRSSRDATPVLLLTRLAESMLRRLQANPGDSREDYSAFVSVLEMIINGARPSLAFPLIRSFIVESKDSSAWQRRLLHPGIMNQLAAKEAEEFFVSLSDVITEKLRQQSQRRQETKTKPNAEETPSPPLVKVTTVKMISQLLRTGTFVKPSLAVDVLARILRHGSHPDIQITAIEALLQSSGDATLKTQIWDMLQTYALPLSTALNERDPETEADWETAENGGALPVIESQDRLLKLFVEQKATADSMLLQLTSLALKESAEKNARWTALFVKKHALSIDPEAFPKVPINPDILMSQLRKTPPSELSLQGFSMAKSYVLFFMDAPQSLKKAREVVRDNTELSKTNAGKHWAKIWDQDARAAFVWGGQWAIGLLEPLAKLEPGRGAGLVDYQMMADFVIQMGEILLSQGDLALFQLFQSSFVVPKSQADKKKGPAAVLRKLIQRINTLRTPAWQADRQRTPPVLPDTVPLRLQLIPLEEHSSAADVIADLLREVVEAGRPYFDRYTKIADLVVGRDRWALAVSLGRLSNMDDADRPSLVDFLRARLAADMLVGKAQIDASDKMLAEMNDMVTEWKGSQVEEFRTLPLVDQFPHTFEKT